MAVTFQRSIVLGELLGWHIHDALLDDVGRVPRAPWQPLGPLGVETLDLHHKSPD